MSGPIKPSDVQKRKDETLPEEVFEVFNQLITEKWGGHSATIMQKEAANRIAAKLGISNSEVYGRRLLDIESAYSKAGWKVEYDKPGFNETYEASWCFSKKRS